ncbi:MAG: hypothetical protein ABH843_01850 [Candidatus Omnitrophota bacterium]
MLKSLFAHFLTIVLLTQSTGAVCLKPHTLAENSSLRSPAFAIADVDARASSSGREEPTLSESDDPYHPKNILETFKKGRLFWNKIPKEYLREDIAVLVNELARLVEKEPYELKVQDFVNPAFLTPSGRKKCLTSLLTFVRKKYNLSSLMKTCSYVKKVSGAKKYLDPKYHPLNILDTFKRNELGWIDIPEEYLWPGVAVFVDEISRLLGKNQYNLNTHDYYKPVLTTYSGEKKSLRGLLDLVHRKNNLCSEGAAISIIRDKLRAAVYVDPKYLPENILHTFLEGSMQWMNIPDEYLEADIRVMADELARLRKKEVKDLVYTDYIDSVFSSTPGKKSKSLSGLLHYLRSKYNLSCKDAAKKILEILGEERTTWSSNDWQEVKKLLEPTMPKYWSTVKSENEMKTYLYSYRITKEQELLLMELMNQGRGNMQALSALIYSHMRQINDFVLFASRKYKVDPAELSSYVFRRLETASLSFNGKARYSTFIQFVMRSARYDYARTKSGTRKKSRGKASQFPEWTNKGGYEATIQDHREAVLFTPENASTLDAIFKALWISERDRYIYI